MSVTTPIKFQDSSLFDYDNTLIQILANEASLIGSPTFSTANPAITSLTIMQASSISAFVETSTKVGSDQLKYTILIGSIEYYWNGSAWVTSDGTYAKANDATTINTNISHASMTALLTGGAYVQIKTFLHSASGSTTPKISEVDLTYVFKEVTPQSPNKCTVYVNLEDILGAVVGSIQNAKFSVKNNDAFKHGSFVILPFVKSVDFDSTGYAEITLNETATPGYPLNFGISYQEGKTIKQINFAPCIVPDAGAIALTSITVPFVHGSSFVPTGSTSGSSGSSNPSETQVSVSDNVAGQVLSGFSLSSTVYQSAIISYSILRRSSLGVLWEIGYLILRFDPVLNTWSIANPVLGGTGTGTVFNVSTGGGPSYPATISFDTDSFSLGGTSYSGSVGYSVLQRFFKES